jgi:hypothetical protein
VKRAIVVVAGGVVAAWVACVFPDGPIIGEACSSSSTCPQGTVCEPDDPAAPTGKAHCLPMPKLDHIPVTCTKQLDCSKAGYPVDAECASGECTCGDSALSNCETTSIDDAHHQACFCPPVSDDAGVGEGEGEGEGGQ